MRMRFQYYILLLLLCNSPMAFAQLEAGSVSAGIASQKYTKESAKRALKDGTAKLIVLSGASLSPNVRQDDLFKTKYGVGYEIKGDGLDGTPREMKNYNYTIFVWLEEKYGKGWLNDVRKDVVGYDKWVLYQDAIPYILCSTKPTFNGGTVSDFTVWVINHMEVDEKDKISSSVLVRVLLSEEGEVIDVDDIREVPSLLTNPFIKAINKAPKWSPAYNDGKPCKVILQLPVHIDFR